MIQSYVSGNPVLYSTLFMLSIVLIKFVFQTTYSYQQEKYGYNIQKKMSQKIFKNIINVEYLEYLKLKSSSITRILNSDLIRINNQFISPIISTLNEFLLILSISLLIINYDVFLGISTLIFSLVTIYIFLLSINKKLKLYSVESMSFATKMIKHILESHKSYITLSFFDVKHNFNRKFNFILEKYVRYGFKTIFLIKLPKNLFELIIFIALSLLIFVLYFSNQTELIVEYIGILSVATFKLIPSLNKLSTSLQAIQYLSKPFSEILRLLNFKNLVNNGFLKIRNINSMKYENLSFSYNNKKIILKNNLNILKNDFIGIIGESGSGKTTLVYILSGLIHNENTQIKVDNTKIESHNLRKLYSIVQQETTILDQNIYENIALDFDLKQINKKKIEDLLKQVNLYETFKEKLEEPLGENGNKISGGQKQRIGIARALYFNKKVLILDESTNSLDKMNQKSIIDLLVKLRKKIIIIFISHNRENLDQCNRIIEVKKGEIIEVK